MWQFLKKTVYNWIDDEPFALAAALSYYTLFSLAPLLTIAIAMAGLFFGQEAAQNQVVETTRGLVGKESAQAIQEMIRKRRREACGWDHIDSVRRHRAALRRRRRGRTTASFFE